MEFVRPIDSVGNSDIAKEAEYSSEERRDQANRLWSHALHEDSDLGQRNNYFLLAESMLVVAYCGLLTAAVTEDFGYGSDRKVFAAHVIGVFGFVMTLIWIYVGRRQWRYTRHVFQRAAELAPEAAATRNSFKGAPFSGSSMMVFGVLAWPPQCG